MNDTLIIGALGLVCSLIAIVTPIVRLNTKIVELAVKVDTLTDKVEKHNNVVERLAVVERDLKTNWTRVDEIRNDIKDIKEQMERK